jgi:hypothetical protein
MLSPEMKALGDQVIFLVKSHVADQVVPLLNTQRDLLARVDKLSQQVSALNKSLAAVQRKAEAK